MTAAKPVGSTALPPELQNCRTVIRREKLEKTEGACTEYWAMQQLLGKDAQPSGAWFMVRDGTALVPTRVCTGQRSPLHRKLRDWFRHEWGRADLVRYRPGHFERCTLRGSQCQPWQRLPGRLRPAVTPEEGEEQRIERAIAWLRGHRILLPYSVARSYGQWACGITTDIDLLLMQDGRPIAIDVKARYATRNGGFGINLAPAEAARALLGTGADVVQLVLDTGKPDTSGRSILELLDEDDFRRTARWRAARLTEELLRERPQTAPAETSLSRRTPQNYIEIPMEHYTAFGTLADPDGKGFREWLTRGAR